MFQFACVMLIVAQFCQYIDSAPSTYFANNTACYIDGKVYELGDLIPSEHPCEVCRCRPPGFSCDLKLCPAVSRPGCRAREVAGQCCPEYDCGCVYNGMAFHEGQKIPHSPTPCVTCYCRANIVRCGFNECKFRFDCEPEYLPGQCCPRYDHCDGKQSDLYLLHRHRKLNNGRDAGRTTAGVATTNAKHIEITTKLPLLGEERRRGGGVNGDLSAKSGSFYGPRRKKLIAHFIEDQPNDLNIMHIPEDNEVGEVTTQPWIRKEVTSQASSTIGTENDLIDGPSTGSISDESEVLTEFTTITAEDNANQQTSTGNVIENESITTIRPLIQTTTNDKRSQGYVRSIYRGTLNLLGNIFARFG